MTSEPKQLTPICPLSIDPAFWILSLAQFLVSLGFSQLILICFSCFNLIILIINAVNLLGTGRRWQKKKSSRLVIYLNHYSKCNSWASLPLPLSSRYSVPCFVLFSFKDGVSCYNPSWLRIYCRDQGGSEFVAILLSLPVRCTFIAYQRWETQEQKLLQP